MLKARTGARAAIVGAALTSILAGAAAVALPMQATDHVSSAQVVAAGTAPDARASRTPSTFMPAADLPVAVADEAPLDDTSTTVAPKMVTPAIRPVTAVAAVAGVKKPAPKPAGKLKPKAAPAVNVVIPTGPLVGKANGADIEGYAPYEPQTTCDPIDKPGAIALRTLLMGYYKGTANFGISRACGTDRSEHYEGRAFDWGVNVNTPSQKAAADNFIAQLMATDSYGHKQALARRMGIMYVIWNHQIWSPGPDSTWRPYTGSHPHTDHVHISLSWAGARAETSFWSGTVVPGLPGDGQYTDGHGGRGYNWPPSGGDDWTPATPTTPTTPSTPTTAPRSRPSRSPGPTTSTTSTTMPTTSTTAASTSSTPGS